MPARPSPYDGLATRYDRSRPSYPPESVTHLRVDVADIVADVGAGTGIFTRQLAAVLREAKVIGVEASEDMHRAAESSSVGIGNLSFAQGKAEALPFEDQTVRMITAATAIHWFDRPAFYAEVARCLRGDGELMLLQNIRRWWEGGFPADYEALHESAVAGYRRGRYPTRHGTYDEINVKEELLMQPDFRDVEVRDYVWSHTMSNDEFVDFSLSSSITQRAVVAMGEQAYLGALRRLLEQWDGSTGMIEIPYLTRVTSAKPATSQDS